MSYENQGIVDGQQAGMCMAHYMMIESNLPYPLGQQPGPTKNPLDTLVDHDASAASPVVASAESTLGGATSGDVHKGMGMPPGGMSSQERHHDGQIGRKRNRQGVDQFGPPGQK
jgi:hypothetical protein